MKSNFKSSLLAIAIGAACFNANAGTVAVTTQTHSLQGLEGVTANQTSNAITYTVDAAYRDGDKITFTFEQGALVKNSFPSVISASAVNSSDPAKAIAGMALGLLNNDDKSVTYRVTSVTQPHNDGCVPTTYTDRTTVGAKLTFGSVTYAPAVALSSGVSVTVSSTTSAGDVLDNGGTRTAKVAIAKSQFGSFAVSKKFDGVIDVAAERKQFIPVAADDASWTVTNPDTKGWLNLATVNTSNGTVFTLTGGKGLLTGHTDKTWATSGKEVVSNDNGTVTVSYAGQVTKETLTFTAPGKDVLEDQDFKGKLIYNYTSAGKTAKSIELTSASDMGDWELNGAEIELPYMPYGAKMSQILQVNNTSNLLADIMVEGFDDKGAFYNLGVIGQAKTNTTTNIAALVKEGLAKQGFTEGTMALTITVNAPEAAVTVHASYVEDGKDHGYVNTSQYKGK